MSPRRRSKRKITVNIQLSKQDLQEYLDDGYSAADIAKDFNVSPAIISEKIKKFGVTKTKHTKVIKKQGGPNSSDKKKPRGRPPKKSFLSRRGRGYVQEKDQSPLQKDSGQVITQAIFDNPEKSVLHIHSLLKSMGFDFEVSLVDHFFKKSKAGSAELYKNKETFAIKEDDVSNEADKSCQEVGLGTWDENDLQDDKNQASITGVDVGSVSDQYDEDGSHKKSCDMVTSKELEKLHGSEEETSHKVHGSTDKEDVVTGEDIGDDEPIKAETVRKWGPGRPRKVFYSLTENPDDMNRCIDHDYDPIKPRPLKKWGGGRPRKVFYSLTEKHDDTNGCIDHDYDPFKPRPVKKEGRGRPRKVFYSLAENHDDMNGCIDHDYDPIKPRPVKKRGPGRPKKVFFSQAENHDDTNGCIVHDNDPIKPRPVKKRGRGRPKKASLQVEDHDANIECFDGESECPKSRPVRKPSCRRPTEVYVEYEEDSTEDSNDENPQDGNLSDDQGSEIRKRSGRKRKVRISKDEQSLKRGRPCLDLSEENLKHCIESGLPREKIAEVFGTCKRSISRYLQMHKMRKKDRFSNISDDELDKMVSALCNEHPEWGQVQIHEELAKKGLLFRRHQVRNSVRRVDPIGIELRKLNNLKLRWNRGSLKKLDKILPADGINMTSTESFISQPPRTGLNSLSQEDSVRLLKSILTSNKEMYEELAPHERDNTSLNLLNGDAPPVKMKSFDKERNSIWNDAQNEQEKETAEELMGIAQKANNTSEVMRLMTKEAGDQENIGPSINQRQDLKIQSPQSSTIENEKELLWKERLYKMVMSSKRTGREASVQKKGAGVYIPKEELKECVELGYSSGRIAEKFSTNKWNVRRYLQEYKLGNARRFEKISDDEIDDIVEDVIQEFAIRKGSDVYSFIKRKGYQIRKADVHKSLSRLFPKGLHRDVSSVVKQSWDASSKPHPSDISYVDIVTHEHEGVTRENVVMLQPEDFAQLMNGEGSIVVVGNQDVTPCGGEVVVVKEDGDSHISTSTEDGVAHTEATEEVVKAGEDEISAIVLEIDISENQVSNPSVHDSDHMGGHGSTPMVPSDATNDFSQDEVIIHKIQKKEHISNGVNTEPTSDESQLMIDHPQVSHSQNETSSAEQEVSLTSLNTVHPSELDARVLFELNRIAQNYQATKDDHSPLEVPHKENKEELL